LEKGRKYRHSLADRRKKGRGEDREGFLKKGREVGRGRDPVLLIAEKKKRDT